MPECGDCEEEFKDNELICAGSAQTVTECTVHDNCDEVFCEPCFDND